MRRVLFVSVLALGLLSASAWAEEDVYVRGKKKFKGNIKEENGRTLVIAGVKKAIPAVDVEDVVYEVLPLAVRLGQYRPAVQAEKDSLDPAKEPQRKANLAKALAGYEAALKDLAPKQDSAQRHLEYKIALLLTRQVHEEGAPADKAIGRLKDFKTRHPNSWQIANSLKLLAGLQMDLKQYPDAELTYMELAQANVADDIRQDAELWTARVSLRAGKHEVAQKKLQELIAKAPKDSLFAARARIAQAECLLAAKKIDDARNLLRQILNQTSDKGLKAVAYNALGESYFQANLFKEARWEFLWVDVVYNQDRAEHARALYFLWRIFEQMGESERAQECREALIDSQFNGLEFQRLAREKKIP